MTTSAKPEETPKYTARQLLVKIQRAGGRVYRFPSGSVFVLTDSRELANELVELGGAPYTPQGADQTMEVGSYRRARGGTIEWDIYIHAIPVLDETEGAIWEMAGRRNAETVNPLDFA